MAIQLATRLKERLVRSFFMLALNRRIYTDTKCRIFYEKKPKKAEFSPR